MYPTLYMLAEDIVSAPASEAYCERIFSVCGALCDGKRIECLLTWREGFL